ncbi:MAG: hypothetical protein M3Q19_07885 [Pseudomonadota bacterium]|nr:hypothetical protein [Pseudomonadota bacterium]
MKRIAAASLLVLCLMACGGPSEEDVLTPEKIRASESAPELPDIQLSENPEPPPAPPEPEEPELNELDNAMMANAVDPLAPAAEGAIPAAFQDRWGQRPADCQPGDTIGGGLVIGGDSLMSRESVGRLVEVVSDYPERFTGVFEYDGQERQEELVLTGSSNTLIRIAGGQRYAYRRCRVASPTG